MTIDPVSGHTRSRALGINNNGQVVGRAANYDSTNQVDINRVAFIWDTTNGVRSLSTLSGESSAWDINDTGQASGESVNASTQTHAVRWDSPTAIVDLGTLANTTTGVAGQRSSANSISSVGLVTGDSDIPNNDGSFIPFHGFARTASGAMVDLKTLDTANANLQFGYSISYDVNASGQVVGIATSTADAGAFAYRAFIWDATNGMRALNRAAAYNTAAYEWYAVAINQSGLIAGHVITAADQSLPYYWTSATATPVALPMPTAYPYGEVYSVNSAGVMVGVMWNAAGTEHAFVFDTAHGVRDLNTLIPAGTGWTLEFARDINNLGQIVGGGTVATNKRAFVLTPAP